MEEIRRGERNDNRNGSLLFITDRSTDAARLTRRGRGEVEVKTLIRTVRAENTLYLDHNTCLHIVRRSFI